MSRGNNDKPFYVDVGTSIAAIRCASNRDVVDWMDHHGQKDLIKIVNDKCDRMNQEAEHFYKQLDNTAKMRIALTAVKKSIDDIGSSSLDCDPEILMMSLTQVCARLSAQIDAALRSAASARQKQDSHQRTGWLACGLTSAAFVTSASHAPTCITTGTRRENQMTTTHTIKFSHAYPKLHRQTSAILLAVIPIRIDRNTPRELIEYDTKFDGGHFPLPTGDYIQLIFLGNLRIPFCTIRKAWPPSKVEYYKKSIGETFAVEVPRDSW